MREYQKVKEEREAAEKESVKDKIPFFSLNISSYIIGFTIFT